MITNLITLICANFIFSLAVNAALIDCKSDDFAKILACLEEKKN